VRGDERLDLGAYFGVARARLVQKRAALLPRPALERGVKQLLDALPTTLHFGF
jgi:hypothetical protein